MKEHVDLTRNRMFHTLKKSNKDFFKFEKDFSIEEAFLNMNRTTSKLWIYNLIESHDDTGLMVTGQVGLIKEFKNYNLMESGQKCVRCGKPIRAPWEGFGTLLCGACENELSKDSQKVTWT